VFANGWWSPVRKESGLAPQLLISMREPTNLAVSHPFRARVAQPSLLADRVSAPFGSSVSPSQTNYTMWESELANSRSRVTVDGVSVYPLLQISYAGWHLPVTLYMQPLRGSDAR
jgi:hypothetical protein